MGAFSVAVSTLSSWWRMNVTCAPGLSAMRRMAVRDGFFAEHAEGGVGPTASGPPFLGHCGNEVPKRLWCPTSLSNA